MTLWEIDQTILNCCDIETGEILDEDALDALAMEREEKIENIGLWVKNLKAEADAIANEIKNLQSRKKVAENKADKLKSYLQESLKGEKFKTSKLTISYRKSESVEITDLNRIDPSFLKYRDPEPDKTAIKTALKEGYEVDGAVLVEKQNMQIK